MNPQTKIKYGGGAKYQTYEERIECKYAPLDMRDSLIIDDIVSMYKYENTTNLLKNYNPDIFQIVKSKTY